MFVHLCLVLASVCNTHPSYSFMLWDWTPTCSDFSLFKQRVDQCKSAGFDTIDLSAAWKSIEAERGTYDFSEIDRRVSYCRNAGLRVRLRINVSYAHAWPDWYDAVLMTGPDGSTPDQVLSPFGPGAVDDWSRLAAATAAHFRDRVECYMPGFGMHMEIKYGAWISYEPEAVRSFRIYLRTRYGTVESLNSAWESHHTSFEEVRPPVPEDGRPDPELSQPEVDSIQFREDHLAYAAERFIKGIKQGYPQAKVAVQLGESYRKESAAMSNLAYRRYSHLADEIVHSYDFFVHPPNKPHHAFESVRTLIGTTGKPVIVEFDGPILFSSYGYKSEHLVGIAKACLDAGASGIHISNYCDVDPRGRGFVDEISKLVRKRVIGPPQADSLFYISKWTVYALRGRDDNIHERIYSYYRKLRAKGEKLRIVSDENLFDEDLGRYKSIYIAYSPVMSDTAYDALTRLTRRKPCESDGRFGVRLVHPDWELRATSQSD